MSIYQFSNYKEYLNHFIATLDRRGVLTEMARAAECSHSYLSQVLSGKPELTPDQALAMTDYLGLSPEQSQYFLAMVLKTRAATSKLRSFFEAQLKELSEKNLQLSQALEKSTGEISAGDRDFYYSSRLASSIHTLTECLQFQTAQELAARLHTSVGDVMPILDWLVQRKLVAKQGTRYVRTAKNIHLPTHSVHNRINHLNWRLAAVESSENPACVHYTSAFTISRADADKLRAQLLRFIKNQRNELAKSGAEEGFAFCCDFFAI